MRTVLLATAAICAVLGCLTLVSEASGGTQPTKLEGLSYLQARKVILSYGWSPLSANCEGVSKASCAQFPEIQSCSEVDPGYCGMVFTNKTRCLYLTTSGGEPEGQRDGDTHVTATNFRAGPCFKG